MPSKDVFMAVLAFVPAVSLLCLCVVMGFADTSMQNQAVLPWRGGLLMADANHGAYGAARDVHLRLILPAAATASN